MNFVFCRYVGVCSAFKITAAILFFFDLLLICYREKKALKLQMKAFTAEEVISSIISLDRLSVFGWNGPETITETDEEQQPLGQQLQDSDYNSAIDDDEQSNSSLIPAAQFSQNNNNTLQSTSNSNIQIELMPSADNHKHHHRSESLV